MSLINTELVESILEAIQEEHPSLPVSTRIAIAQKRLNQLEEENV